MASHATTLRKLGLELSRVETEHTKVAEEIRALRNKAEEEKTQLKLSVAVQGTSGDATFTFRIGDAQVTVPGGSEATLSCAVADIDDAAQLEMVAGEEGEVIHKWLVSSIPVEEQVELAAAADGVPAKTCLVQVARIVSRTNTELAEKEKQKEQLFSERMRIKRDMGEIQQAQRATGALTSAPAGRAGNSLAAAGKSARFSKVLSLWNSAKKYSSILFLGLFGVRNVLFFIGGVGALHYFGDDLAV